MTRRALLALAALFVVVAACTSAEPEATDTSLLQPDNPSGQRVGSFAGTEPAPEFPRGLDWLNVEAPLSMAALRGKVVLLDFWTYGCINCIHIIPDLERLESEYPDELVVIGVHSAKFENEGETENIRDVVARYGLEHPVVNDADFTVWRTWGAQAWPTVVAVDPAGNVVGGHSGEGIYRVFQPVIDSLVEEFDERGQLDRTPVELALEAEDIPDSVLSFPGKVLADAPRGRLFVADTNHHRILVADIETGEIVDVAGTGAAGYADGEFEAAQFDQPQGMALSADGRLLYLADTGSHAVRALDLTRREVVTVLGTGQQSVPYPPRPGTGIETAIASPWDVEVDGDRLLVAMAGSHQIWELELDSGNARWFAGNGRESTANGLRLDAELAQPSGVTVLDDGTVVFADAESSSIRFVEPGPAGETGVLAGADASLFDFGDVDGVGTEARLQHPLGIDTAGGTLWVADTYNSKIKRLDPDTGEITTFSGSEQGWADGISGEARFSEPGGLSVAGGTLYVADTNNHAIRTIDLATGAVGTVVLHGIEDFPQAAGTEASVIDAGTIEVTEGPGEIVLDVRLPDGFKVNDLAPFAMRWDVTGSEVVDGDRSILAPEFPLHLEATFGAGSLAVDLVTYYCSDDSEALCFIDQVRLAVAVVVADGGGSTAVLERVIPAP